MCVILVDIETREMKTACRCISCPDDAACCHEDYFPTKSHTYKGVIECYYWPWQPQPWSFDEYLAD